MKNKLTRIVPLYLLALIIASCGSTKEVSQQVAEPVQELEPVPVPEGIGFQTFSNYKDIAEINIPMTGNGFKSSIESPDQVLPSIKYNEYHFSIWSDIKGFEGTLEEQFEKVKRSQGIVIKETSTVVFEKKTIDGKEVALMDIYTNLGHDYRTLAYGYLIQHDNKASLLFVKDGYFMPEGDIEAYKSTLDEAMQYMIKTLQFK